MANLYRLSAELHGHQFDVRSVAATGDGGIVTGSRDKTAKLWEVSTEAGYVQAVSYMDAEDFISVVASCPPNNDFPEGLIVTASKDKLIRVYVGRSTEPLYTLAGHTENVSCLAIGADGTIVSGSWDFTVRVWREGHCVSVLNGHTKAVWGVLYLGGSRVISAAADHQICIWQDGVCAKTIAAHTDAVRGLAALPTGGFVSCGNDAVVKIWSEDGALQSELHGHTAFVYSVCVIGEEIASCGEDRALRIWRGGECVQVITHPATSVWSVAALSNGDVVTGASDGVARVFTRCPERVALADVLLKYEQNVAAQTIPSNQLGDMNKEEIPGRESLARPGTREGMTKLVRQEDGKIHCYQWTNGSWQCMGEVVDAVGSGRKQLFNGKEYDNVFDIDIGDGTFLKLPYNTNENPYTAAHDFLEQHEISQDHLETVAQFIITNTKGQKVDTKMPSGSADPFTGAGAYTTSSSSNYTAGQAAGSGDPFTGGGAYISGSSSGRTTGPARPPAFTDPFTGTGAYVSETFEQQRRAANGISTSPSPTAGNSFYPHTGYLYFDSTNLEGLVKKLKEFNEKVAEDEKANSRELDEVAVMVSSFRESHLTTLSKLLTWPDHLIFPVLDVLRLVILQRDGAKALAAFEPQLNIISKLLDIINNKEAPSAANVFLSARYLANAFQHPETRLLMEQHATKTLSAMDSLFSHSNRNVLLAAVTVILNYSVLLGPKPGVAEVKLDVITGAATVLNVVADPEVVFRALVAMGTMVSSDQMSLANAKQLNIKPLVASKITNPTQKVKECAAILNNVL